MPSLSVRKVDEETMSQLRVQAAKHGVSMEEEVRRIIKRAVSTPENLGDLAVRLFSTAYGGDELNLPERKVKVLEVEKQGRVRLSMKEVGKDD